MKVNIIFFSSWETTWEISRKFSECFSSLGWEAELFDLSEVLKNQKEDHSDINRLFNADLIIFAAPVYARLYPKVCVEFLSSVSSQEVSGKPVFLIASYGGITSGMALHNAAVILNEKGMKVVGGMKIRTPHSLYLNDRVVSENWGDFTLVESIKESVENIVERMKEVPENSGLDFLNYQSPEEQSLVGAKVLPPVELNADNCTACGAYVEKCPVNRLELMKDRVQENHALNCIACGECSFICSKNCFVYPNLEIVQSFLKRQLDSGKEMSGEPKGTNAFFPE